MFRLTKTTGSQIRMGQGRTRYSLQRTRAGNSCTGVIKRWSSTLHSQTTLGKSCIGSTEYLMCDNDNEEINRSMKEYDRARYLALEGCIRRRYS
jgi:hypothetical protein